MASENHLFFLGYLQADAFCSLAAGLKIGMYFSYRSPMLYFQYHKSTKEGLKLLFLECFLPFFPTLLGLGHSVGAYWENAARSAAVRGPIIMSHQRIEQKSPSAAQWLPYHKITVHFLLFSGATTLECAKSQKVAQFLGNDCHGKNEIRLNEGAN